MLVDESYNQPQACDSVNFWSFSGNPFHDDLLKPASSDKQSGR